MPTLPDARLPTPSGRTTSGVIDPILGTVLDDRYRIIRRLGTGGMATVYLAEHMFIGRKVAVKVLHPQLAADENFVRRFLNEGRAAGTLGHPNIIASTDMGTTPLGQPYLVLEYLEGKDLAQVIERDGALPPVRAARVAVQVASALAAAHSSKIIHRDLKAENIFLLNRNDRRDEVRVIDFGISKFGSTQATYAGLLIGTPQYMAPEQLSNPSEVDERADIYALGVILFQMITGKLPFADPTIPGLVTKIANEHPPELSTLVPTVPSGLSRLVSTALSKDPHQRPESMAAFEEQLSRYANLGSPSLETQAVDLRPAPVAAPTPPAKSVSPTLLLGALVVLGLGIGAMVLKPWERAERPTPTVAEAPKPPAPVAVAAVQPAPAPAVEPAPAAAVAAPEPAPAVIQAPTAVRLKVTSSVRKARVAFRGRVHPLPLNIEVKPGTTPESIEVTAPGHTGRRFWVTLNEEKMELSAPLTRGTGVVEAGETETLVALGHAPPEEPEAEKVEKADRPERADRPAARVAAARREEKPTATPEKEKPAAAEKKEDEKKAGPVAGELAMATPAPQPSAAHKEPAAAPAPPAAKAEPAPAPAVATAAPAPEAPKDDTKVIGNPFDLPELRNAITGQVNTLKTCTETAKSDNSNFQGSVTLTMELNSDGSVSTVSANAGPGNGKFAACVIRTVRKWSFPKQQANKTRMVFPLILG